MTENIEKKIDAIVVGAGPSGIGCAITLARAKKKVVLMERGDFSGAKNVFGGVMYKNALEKVFPNVLENAPIERLINQSRYLVLTQEEGVEIKYSHQAKTQDNCDISAFTVIRGKFDKWCVKEAVKQGVYFAPQTNVKNIIVENGYVIGVETQLEKIYAPIVIIADGVNSLLAKQLNLRNEIEPKDVALAVKEVLELDENIINERFNVNESNFGVEYQIFGYPLNKDLGIGFLYTNKSTISIGIGIALDELKKSGKKPYEYLNELKEHPTIKPLIKDTKLVEYNAHLIPEGGYKKIPKLYSNGVMIVGDAAMLVNNLHCEGTNLALISGVLAGQTAINALDKKDYSAKMLKQYEKKLKQSFILKDLNSYKNLMAIVKSRKEHFLDFYPKKMIEFFNIYTDASFVPKKTLFFKFFCNFLSNRPFLEIFKDICAIMRIILGVFK